MIAADKRPFFNRWFAGQARSRLQQTFASVQVSGLAAARASAQAFPTLAVVNHTAWWDPLVVIYLSNFVLDTDAFAMMDAKNLEQMRFFKRVGGFGVDLTDPADGARAMRYAVKLLNAKGRMVWIFPQGDERPITEPLAFRAGSAEIARLAKGCKVQPLALRYEFGREEKPHLYMAFGPAFDADRDVKAGLLAQQDAVAREVGRIDDHLRSIRTTEFELLWQAKPSAIAQWMTRCLSWFVG